MAETIRRLPGHDRIFVAALIKPTGSAEITRLLAAALARG